MVQVLTDPHADLDAQRERHPRRRSRLAPARAARRRPPAHRAVSQIRSGVPADLAPLVVASVGLHRGLDPRRRCSASASACSIDICAGPDARRPRSCSPPSATAPAACASCAIPRTGSCRSRSARPRPRSRRSGSRCCSSCSASKRRCPCCCCARSC